MSVVNNFVRDAFEMKVGNGIARHMDNEMEVLRLKGSYAKFVLSVFAQDLVEISAGQDVSGFYLPPVSKNGFFQGIIYDGALPRKTFSMGEAHEKRFYIEAQQILD